MFYICIFCVYIKMNMEFVKLEVFISKPLAKI